MAGLTQLCARSNPALNSRITGILLVLAALAIFVWPAIAISILIFLAVVRNGAAVRRPLEGMKSENSAGAGKKRAAAAAYNRSGEDNRCIGGHRGRVGSRIVLVIWMIGGHIAGCRTDEENENGREEENENDRGERESGDHNDRGSRGDPGCRSLWVRMILRPAVLAVLVVLALGNRGRSDQATYS